LSELTGASPDPALPPGSLDDAALSPFPGRRGGGGGGFLGEGLQRATLWMAAGTTLSRLTGLLRILVLAYALGATHLATSYNLANTTPNMLYDVVLGGVLSATFIPVFVDRLATRSEREAWRAISAVVTLSVVVLVVMTVVFFVAAPQIIDAFTSLGHAAPHQNLSGERDVAVALLRWFVPQVALYGFIALITALLNTRRRFVAPMWVPIANNLVCIGVLLVFRHLTTTPSLSGVQSHTGWIVLLGLGTTMGVALQALLLLFAARGAGLSKVRWRWEPRHEAVRTVVGLGGWTFGFVVANQIALFVVLALAVHAPGPDPVSSYTYAYTFMQMPYAVVAVSVMSAVTPGLAERWTVGDLAGFRRRMAGGLRAVLAVILPAAMGMLLLAKPAVDLLFAHGSYSVADAGDTGSALALFALGLPGFCTFLYVVRVLQAMQRTRVAFWLYLVENGVNVVLALALVHPMGVRGLALALSVAYSLAALCGLAVLRSWLGTIGGPGAWAPLRRDGIATVVMGAVVLVVSNLSAAVQGLALLARVVASVIVGAVVYVGASVLLGRWADRRRPGHPGRGGTGDRRRVGGTGGPRSASPPVASPPGATGSPAGTVRRVGGSGPGPAGWDRRRGVSATYGGGVEYGGMGPGTGMVPPVGPVGTGGTVRVLGPRGGPRGDESGGDLPHVRPRSPSARDRLPYDAEEEDGGPSAGGGPGRRRSRSDRPE
jgi:putative peptidoglycan lipid II flippase